MQYSHPRYYSDFFCLASACPDSCCALWEVDVDAASARRYRNLPGLLGACLREALHDTESGTVLQLTDGRCPMWRRDGLCEIQARLGQDGLCEVCREYPRLRHDYGSFTEAMLELSCPEAARLILTSPAQELISEQVPGGEAPDYDEYAMQTLLRTRAELFAFLSTCSVPESLAGMLVYAYRVQEKLDGGAPAHLDAAQCLKTAQELAVPASMEDIFAFFRKLEILTPAWRAMLEKAPAPFSWREEHRALARYGVLRYYLQSVSDLDVVSRVKFIVISCLLAAAMGGDPVVTAQLYSKEIENDCDNVNAILDAAYTVPAFADTKLLGLLLNQ